MDRSKQQPMNRHRRGAFAAGAATPAVIALVLIAFGAVEDENRREISCWVLPNGRVIATPGDATCPLRLHDRIRGFQDVNGGMVRFADGRQIAAAIREAQKTLVLLIEGPDGEAWKQISVLEPSIATRIGRVGAAAVVVVAMLTLPTLLLWRSYAPAAVPFSVLYGAIAFIMVAFIGGRHSDILTRASLIAMGTAPAALMHLSLTFPRERRLIRDSPRLALAPYLLAGFLVAAGWFALDRYALLWPAFVYFVLAMTSIAWMILIASCYFAMVESGSVVERARARVLCLGSLLLPIGPTLFFVRHSTGIGELVTAYLWVATVTVPLPIGLAISHYNLFNLGADVRRWIGRSIYFGGASLMFFIVVQVAFELARGDSSSHDPAVLFLACAATVIGIEPLRSRLLGLLETVLSPEVARLRSLRAAYERRMAQPRGADDVARELGETLQEAIGAVSGSIFVRGDECWVVAHSFGSSPPVEAGIVIHAVEALAGEGLVHLAHDLDDDSAPRRALRREGIEVVVDLERGRRRGGISVIGRSRKGRPYTGSEIDFVATAASLAGIALENARLTEDLLGAERRATTGRVALALAHDVGKEIDWVDRLVQRLPQMIDDRTRLVRDIDRIQDFTGSVLQSLREFVADATRSSAEVLSLVAFDAIVDQAIRRVARRHGPGRVSESISPETRSIACHEHIGRVITNLLDNALHASTSGDTVDLFATAKDGVLRIVVVDRGCGIPESVRADVFRPGFSTRDQDTGLGIGLSVSREIVESLNGTLELAENLGRGTRATVCIPIEEGRSCLGTAG
jgi:signal transduction histidine kinase